MIGPEKDELMQISVLLTRHWVTIKKPLSIKKNIRKLQKKSVIEPERDEPMEISVLLATH